MNKLTELFFDGPTCVFSQPEVAVVVGGSDFSRHGLVKRAMAGGEILNIRRGLYCLAPRYQKKPISVYSLAQRIYGPSYISLATALSYHGWIPEAVYACTSASYKNAREFTTPLGIFDYKRVPQKMFYAGVERCVDKNGNIFLMALPAKALADYVYVHRPSWASISEAAAGLRIEPDDLATVEPRQLSALADNCTSGRVKRFLASWKEAVAS